LGIRELKANSNNNLANGRGTGYIIISTGKCRAFDIDKKSRFQYAIGRAFDTSRI
jgi:hypothetical protein